MSSESSCTLEGDIPGPPLRSIPLALAVGLSRATLKAAAACQLHFLSWLFCHSNSRASSAVALRLCVCVYVCDVYAPPSRSQCAWHGIYIYIYIYIYICVCVCATVCVCVTSLRVCVSVCGCMCMCVSMLNFSATGSEKTVCHAVRHGGDRRWH